MTIHFRKLDKLLTLSFETAEMQESIMQTVKESVVDIKMCLKKLVSTGSSGLNKLMEKIVSFEIVK